MTTNETPTDPQVLRDEIAQIRADLGDTVEALAAKTDVKARTQDAIADVTEQAKNAMRTARDQASHLVDSAGDQVRRLAENTRDQARSSAASLRDAVDDTDLADVVTKPLPVALLVTAAAVVGIVIYLWRRRS